MSNYHEDNEWADEKMLDAVFDELSRQADQMRGVTFTLALETKCGAIRDDIIYPWPVPKQYHAPLFTPKPYNEFVDQDLNKPVKYEERVFELQRVNYEVKIAFYKEV